MEGALFGFWLVVLPKSKNPKLFTPLLAILLFEVVLVVGLEIVEGVLVLVLVVVGMLVERVLVLVLVFLKSKN